MLSITALWALILLLALVVGWLLTLLAMPGNWLIVTVAALYAWLVPADSSLDFGWPIVAVLLGLALLGEIIELGAAAAGVTKAGGNRRSATLALLGSLVGAVVGMFVGLPIPVVGSLAGAILFAAAGALVGAMLGESGQGKAWDQSWSVGKAAFRGRLLGTLAKIAIATLMVGIALGALVL